MPKTIGFSSIPHTDARMVGFRPFRAVMVVLFFSLASILETPQAQAQQLLHSAILPWAPTQYSIDRAGHVYLSDAQGSIMKLDSTAKILYTNANERPAEPTTLEAWPTLRIFCFYREFQQYSVFDRFLTNAEAINVPASVGYARLLSPAADENLWVVDDADQALKKLNPYSGAVLVSQPLALVTTASTDVVWLKEYQNRVLLLSASGQLLVFDNMATLIKKIPVPKGLKKVDVAGTLVYWPQEGRTDTSPPKLEGIDLYTGKQWMQVLNHFLPAVNVPTQVWLSGGRIWVLRGKDLYIYGL